MSTETCKHTSEQDCLEDWQFQDQLAKWGFLGRVEEPLKRCDIETALAKKGNGSGISHELYQRLLIILGAEERFLVPFKRASQFVYNYPDNSINERGFHTYIWNLKQSLVNPRLFYSIGQRVIGLGVTHFHLSRSQTRLLHLLYSNAGIVTSQEISSELDQSPKATFGCLKRFKDLCDRNIEISITLRAVGDSLPKPRILVDKSA